MDFGGANVCKLLLFGLYIVKYGVVPYGDYDSYDLCLSFFHLFDCSFAGCFFCSGREKGGVRSL